MPQGRSAVRVTVRTLPLVFALVAGLVSGPASGARTSVSAVSIVLSFGATPSLRVATVSGSTSGGSLGTLVSGDQTPVSPAQVTVDLASAYTAPAAPVGSTVGIASVTSVSSSTGGLSFAVVTAPLTVDDPGRYVNDPVAQACAPPPYAAVWRMTSTILGLDYALPVFVEHPAGNPQRVELRFCAPPLVDGNGKPVTTTPVPLTSVEFLLLGLRGPTRPGRYTSHAFVTPEDTTGAPAASATVEARAVDPVPHTLTFKGRFDSKAHAAVLTGRVSEAGKPQSGATVEYLRLDMLSEPRHLRTSAKGTFAARVGIAATTTFVADVPDATGSCAGTSSAARGCVSLTVAGTNSRVARVVVPR